MKNGFAELGSVAEFINGAAFKPEDWSDSGQRIIRIQNLTDPTKPFNRTMRVVPTKLHVEPGDLLVSWSATLGVFEWRGPDVGLLNQHIFRVLPDTSRVDKRYLRYGLELALVEMKRHLHGATMQHVNRREFLGTKLFMPPSAEQRRIAGILDKAEALRAKRRAALAKIDILPQSIFLELFSEMSKDNFAALSDVANLKRGPFGAALKKEIFVESGYKVYEQKNAIQNDFTIGRYFITETKYRQMEDFAVKANDLIVSCSGTLGKVAVVPETAAPGVINQALLRVRPNIARVTTLFLKHALEQPKVQAKLVGFSHGTGLQNFPPMSEVRALKVPAPSLELQREFARRVSAVEKLKAAQRASLAKLDALFASLQHRAFRGEL